MGRKYIGNHICLITKGKGSAQGKNGVIVIAHGEKLANKSFDMDGGAVCLTSRIPWCSRRGSSP